MDTLLALLSKRDEREYAQRPIRDDVVRRILDAGRLAGSARNKQPCRFLILESRSLVEGVAESVFAPGNLLSARLVVAIVVSGRGPVTFDAGRAAQNMMLAAWNMGVVSCPNGMADSEKTAKLLGLESGEQPVIMLSFGYPERPRSPQSRPPEEWIKRARRKPFEEVVSRL